MELGYRDSIGFAEFRSKGTEIVPSSSELAEGNGKGEGEVDSTRWRSFHSSDDGKAFDCVCAVYLRDRNGKVLKFGLFSWKGGKGLSFFSIVRHGSLLLAKLGKRGTFVS